MTTTLLMLLCATCPTCSLKPTIDYSLRIDPAHLNVSQVEIRLSGMPQTFSLAMRVHGEYDARYWRYVDSFDVEQTTADAAAGVPRTDSTLWHVSLPGGRGVIRYRVHI